MEPHAIVTKSEFARRCGVAPASISEACRKKLKRALVGKRINMKHKAAIEYVETQMARAAEPKKSPTGWTAKNAERKKAAPPSVDLSGLPKRIRDLAHWTLEDLSARFGTDVAFVDWLKATKELENIHEKRLKNGREEGQLVHRDLVKRGFVDPVEEMVVKLMTDGSKTMARRILAMAGSGRTVEDVEKYIREQIGSFVRPMKAKVARILGEVGE